MDKQNEDAKSKLPFEPKHAFYELYDRLTDDAAKVRLWKVKEIFQLDASDPLWGIILALDYHVALYERLPENIENVGTRLNASFLQVLQEFRSTKDELRQEMITFGDTILTDLIKQLSKSVAAGVDTSTKELTANLGLLLGYLQDGVQRKALVEPLRLDVQKIASEYNAEMIKTIRKAGNATVDLVKAAIPAAKRQGMILGALGVIGLALMALNLTLLLVNDYTWTISAKATLADERVRIVAFVAGLDKYSQANITRHNSHLPEDQRLPLPSSPPQH